MKAGILGILGILIGAGPVFGADECDVLSAKGSGLYVSSRNGASFIKLGKDNSIEFDRRVRFYFVQDVGSSRRENIWNVELLTAAVDNKKLAKKVWLKRGAVETDCIQEFDGVALNRPVDGGVDYDDYFSYLAARHQSSTLKKWHFWGGYPSCESTRSLVGDFEDLNDDDNRTRKTFRPKKVPIEQFIPGEAIAGSQVGGERHKPNTRYADLASLLVFKAKKDTRLCREIDPVPGLSWLSFWKPSRTKVIIRDLGREKVRAYSVRWVHNE
ncbi:MAG: hypothetical protein ACOZAM_00460 [Pseudomonadota bacterium]